MPPAVPHSPKTIHRAVLTALFLFFFFAVAILPYPGLQNDECLFVQPLYGPIAAIYRTTLFHHEAALMLMSYLGTLKTWVFALLFAFVHPSVWSIRIPGLLTGAATIWIFSRLLGRLAGSFAALAGAFLLALDPSFLLTTVFDWGPVAFQHFLLVAGLYALLLFNDCGSGSRGPRAPLLLGTGFFCFGLALWDKALFSWMLFGLGVAAAILLTKQIRRHLTVRNAALAAAAFAFGAWPLILYNVRSDLETFRGNTKLSAAEIWPKTLMLPNAINGSGLFGYLIREDDEGPRRLPETGLEQSAAWLADHLGPRRNSLMSWAILLTLLAFPLWRRRAKVMLFALIAGTCAWLVMSATVGAGGSVHHIVLLWPLPQWLVAAGIATAIEDRAPALRRAASALIALVVLSQALVLNQYYANAIRQGSGLSWTDAIFPLNETITRLKPDHVNFMDWGNEFNLLALEQGRIDLRWGAEPGEREVPNDNDQRLLTVFLEQENSLWIRHFQPVDTPAVKNTERFDQRAAARGYRKQSLATVPDRNGRQIFEVYRFVKEGN